MNFLKVLQYCFIFILSITFLLFMWITTQGFGGVQHLRFSPTAFSDKSNSLNNKTLNHAFNNKIKVLDAQPTRVLVVTYFRSGSTLIGDLLQQVNDSSYFFEPLQHITGDIMYGNVVTFLNKRRRSYPRSDSIYVMAKMIYNWFTCDVRNINIRDLTSMMFHHSVTYKKYIKCVNQPGIYQSITKSIESVNRCVELLLKPCLSRKATIIKTIRLDMASVELLLKWLPGLKVVHLFRDPRSSLISGIKLHETKSWDWPYIERLALSRCDQMLSDILITERLNKQYPDTIRILQYESFTNDSIQKSKSLFSFLNLEFTPRIRKYVESVTLQTKSVDRCDWCVKKTNAKLTSSKWRLSIQEKHVRQIDSQCKKLYETAGFVKIKDSKSLRNLSVPLQIYKLKYMSL